MGTGKTKAMVEALPEGGSVVIVHNGQTADYVRRMIVDLRGRHVMLNTRVRTVASCDAAVGALLGVREPVFVDHAFQERALPSVKARVAELIGGIQGHNPVLDHLKRAVAALPSMVLEAGEEPLRAMVSCLELRDGDIVVLRTMSPLTREQARASKDSLDRLTAERGLRNVSLLLIDPGAELTVLRPAPEAQDKPAEVSAEPVERAA